MLIGLHHFRGSSVHGSARTAALQFRWGQARGPGPASYLCTQLHHVRDARQGLGFSIFNCRYRSPFARPQFKKSYICSYGLILFSRTGAACCFLRRTKVQMARGALPHDLVVVPQRRWQGAVPPPELGICGGDEPAAAARRLD